MKPLEAVIRENEGDFVMKKKIIGLLSALTIGTLCLGTAHAAERPVGMANPMVAYDTVAAAKTAAGFQPLYLPSITGYHVNQVWVIGGDLIDIEYCSDSQPAGKFRLRTARCTEHTNDNISGIYGATWNTEKMNGLSVAIAELVDHNNNSVSYAAHWTHNNMLFSVHGEKLTYSEFWRLLNYGLVELSQNYF